MKPPPGRSFFRRVATASADGTARIWLVDLTPTARARKPPELTAREREPYEIRTPQERSTAQP
jgi:hypothetical protein